MTELHTHKYDLTTWPEGRCACGDLGMYPPIENVGNNMWATIPPERGPAFWCQTCGAHFMTQRWAYEHYSAPAKAAARGELAPCNLPVLVQLRQVA